MNVVSLSSCHKLNQLLNVRDLVWVSVLQQETGLHTYTLTLTSTLIRLIENVTPHTHNIARSSLSIHIGL